MEDKEQILACVPEHMKKNLEILENAHGKLLIKDGVEFEANLRKEVRRQKTIKICEDLEQQIRPIEDIPAAPLEAYERQLADSFEIIEE